MLVWYDSFKNHSTKIGSYYHRSKNGLFLQRCITLNAEKVVVKLLQGSVVTQTMLGGLTIYPLVANFVCAKNMKTG